MRIEFFKATGVRRVFEVSAMAWTALTLSGAMLPWAQAEPKPAEASGGFRSYLSNLPFSLARLPEEDLSKKPISETIWKDAAVADIRFSYRGDKRKNRSWTGGRNDFEIHEINPDGRIDGSEVLALARPMERALYDAMIGSRIADPAEREKSYQEYLKRSFEQSVGVLALNRILDHEAMKRLVLPNTTLDRINYVKRVWLVRFAIETKKVPTRQEGDDIVAAKPRELALISDEQLYQWMKEAVGAQTIKFNVDWNYRDGGVEDLRWQLANNGKEIPGWPSTLKISFRKLPDSLEDFEKEIAKQLDATYRTVIRQFAWRTLVGERKPHIQWETLFAVNTSDEKKFYETLKAREFSVATLGAVAQEWTVAGASAQAFLAEVEKLAAEREKVLTEEIKAAGIPSDPQAIAVLREKVKQYRQIEISNIIQTLSTGAYAADISAGRLTIASKPLSFETDGATVLPEDDSVSSKQIRAVFDQRFSSVLFPRQVAQDEAGGSHLLVLVETTQGAPKALPIDHPKVRQALRGMMQLRKQGFVFRELAYDLLRENPLNLKVDACSDPRWPCSKIDNSRLAEVLFPETIFPGESLGNYGSASVTPIPSTLLEPQLRDKVMTISLDLLQASFQVPNDREVSPTRW